MNNTIVNDTWYLIYYENEEDDNKSFIETHNDCEMGNEIVYIDICDYNSHINAMRFRTKSEAQNTINFFVKKYPWFENEKHKVLCCKISVDIIESDDE